MGVFGLAHWVWSGAGLLHERALAAGWQRETRNAFCAPLTISDCLTDQPRQTSRVISSRSNPAQRPGLLRDPPHQGCPPTVSHPSMKVLAGGARPSMTPSVPAARRRADAATAATATAARPLPRSCDTFVALPDSTSDGSIVFGKNSDRETEVRAADFRPTHQRYLALSFCASSSLPALFQRHRRFKRWWPSQLQSTLQAAQCGVPTLRCHRRRARWLLCCHGPRGCGVRRWALMTRWAVLPAYCRRLGLGYGQCALGMRQFKACGT